MSIITFMAFLILLLFFIGLSNTSLREDNRIQKRKSLPPIKLVKSEPTNNLPKREFNSVSEQDLISVPRQLRRAQQALIRQKNVLSENFKSLYHEQRVIDISRGLNQLNERHTQIQDATIGLKHKQMDIMQKSNELKSRADLVLIQEAQAKLLGTQFDIQVGRAENQINGKRNELLSIGLEQANQQNLIEYRSRALDLKDQKLDIKKTSIKTEKDALKNEQVRLKLIGETNNIEKREALLEIKKKDLSVGRMSLQNILDKIANKHEGLQLQDRENRVNAADRHLGVRKGELLNIYDRIVNKADEVRLAKKDLLLSYNTSKQHLTGILEKINLEYKNLKLTRYENKLIWQENKLGVVRQELNSMKQYIEQMYNIRSQLLKIEGSKNDLAYRQQQMRLDQAHADTQNQIQRLQFARQSDNMKYREQKLALQKLAFSVKNVWLK